MIESLTGPRYAGQRTSTYQLICQKCLERARQNNPDNADHLIRVD